MELPRKRGRKRKLKDAQDEDGAVQLGATKPVISLLGRYLKKQFDGKYYIGKVIFYDSALYRVEYDDGDCEDLDSGEVRPFLIPDDAFTKALLNKKRKLDDMIYAKSRDSQIMEAEDGKLNSTSEKHVGENEVEEKVCEGDSDVDSSGIDSASGHAAAVEELVTIAPLELPPSSATILVPEEYVSHLFSVYSFLRSFSIRLFLSPFGLDDFVGALKCPTQNNLLDAIHVTLLRALRGHLEATSADVSDLSSICLRCIDWSLLDSLTWPVYVVRYAMIMGYTKGKEWRGFYGNVIEKEYYSLPTKMKLVILQMLCDDVLNSAEIREEIDMREEEEGDASETITDDLSERMPRRVHPRFSKTSACKDVNKIIVDKQAAKSDSKSDDQDSNCDECRLCGMDGTLLCCDGCPSAYHSRCIGVNKLIIPDGAWYCPECTVDKTGHIALASLQSAEMFGIDSNKRVFFGTCDHLLVLKAFVDEEPFLRYYNKNDTKKVAQILYSSKYIMYSGICEGILKFWNLSEESFEHNGKAETEQTVPNHEGSFSGAAQTRLTVNSSVHDAASYSSSNSSGFRLHASSLRFRLKNPFPARVGINERKSCIYSGSCFKHNAYVNHYAHGNFAASAAANFAALSSEENTVLGVHASENVKKAMSVNVLLQVKAFGSAASRFFWPNSEKKFTEVPKERCGWCLSCQGAVTSKKACMLNAACLNAHRGAMKFLSGFQACKSEDACLASIAIYLLYIEDSFNVLLVGPFMNANYRRQWRKKLGHASTCYALKSFLLELERNIRDVALSSDWFKLVGDSISESWDLPNSSQTPAPIPKRGRRKRKLLSSSEAPEREEKDDINWWRGGKMSKLIFQKGILASQILKKAARQGGRNKLPGVDYYDADSEIPRRSRQLIWRSSVEMCKNTSQLALQVRILDHHLRWIDLNRPDQSSHDGKGADSEASVFRNGVICDKRTVWPRISYAVVFGNQKHLPLRIMKTVTDIEQGQDGKEKHWFPEMRIPLYLIKEFEAGMIEAHPQLVNRTTKTLSILQMKQLKDARRNIFSYLACKRDNLSKCSCTACPMEVLLRDAVKCSDCQGYCHVDCTLSSKVPGSIGSGLITTFSCKQCYFMKPLTQGRSSNSPTSPLLPLQAQGQNRSAVKGINSTQPRSVNQHLSTVGIDKSHHATKPNASNTTLTKKKKKIMSWGLIWKKKPTEDNREFLRTNLLLRGITSSESPKPVCALCQKPYNPELIYIRCEMCKKWYHGDAVELDMSKISELMGFKCCKCRRIRSPDCPYLDSDKIKTKVIGSLLDSNLDISGLQPFDDVETYGEEESSSPLYLNTDDIFMQSDDPLLFSLARVEQVTEPFPESVIGWDTTELGAKKLPVRKLIKNEDGSNYLEPANGPVCYDAQLTDEFSNEAAQDELMFDLDSIDYEDMEFEPHTYFSMTELLEDGETDAHHAPVNDHGLCPTASTSNLATAGGMREPHSNSIQASSEHQDNQRLEEFQKCDSCQSAVLTPDLHCDLCGLSIHRDCSPWFETTSLVDNWRCGCCREWQ